MKMSIVEIFEIKITENNKVKASSIYNVIIRTMITVNKTLALMSEIMTIMKTLIGMMMAVMVTTMMMKRIHNSKQHQPSQTCSGR